MTMTVATNADIDNNDNTGNDDNENDDNDNQQPTIAIMIKT